VEPRAPCASVGRVMIVRSRQRDRTSLAGERRTIREAGDESFVAAVGRHRAAIGRRAHARRTRPGSRRRYPPSSNGGQAREPMGVMILGSSAASGGGVVEERDASLASPSLPESLTAFGTRPRGVSEPQAATPTTAPAPALATRSRSLGGDNGVFR
jgi:hypothetical protein